MIALYLVDVQNDFMNPNGLYYINNSELIKNNINKCVRKAYFNKIQMIGSVDRHFGTKEYEKIETELQCNGGKFPNHCINETEGQQLIFEARLPEINTCFIPNNIVCEEIEDFEQIFFEKQCFNIFSEFGGNKNLLNYIKMKKITDVIIVGVVTEISINFTVEGFLNNNINVHLLEDCIMHINENKSSEFLLNTLKLYNNFFVTTSKLFCI